MKYFFDTEFVDDGVNLSLISIGIVAEDGREYYAETGSWDNASEWVLENVVTQLQGGEYIRTRQQMRYDIVRFVGADHQIEFWGWFADYDWVLFTRIFGGMLQVPTNFPQLSMDLTQMMVHKKIPRKWLPVQEESEHHALHDARWTKQACEACFLI